MRLGYEKQKKKQTCLRNEGEHSVNSRPFCFTNIKNYQHDLTITCNYYTQKKFSDCKTHLGIWLMNLRVVSSPLMTALLCLSEEMTQQIGLLPPCGAPLSCYTPAVSCPGCPLFEMTQTKPLPTAVTNSSLRTVTVPHLHPEWQLPQSPLNHIISPWLGEILVPFSIKSITGDDGDSVTCRRERPAAVWSASSQPASSLNRWLRASFLFRLCEWWRNSGKCLMNVRCIGACTLSPFKGLTGNLASALRTLFQAQFSCLLAAFQGSEADIVGGLFWAGGTSPFCFAQAVGRLARAKSSRYSSSPYL